MLFYVDDSVIFTNGPHGFLNESAFAETIKKLNEDIENETKNILETKGVESIIPETLYNYQNLVVKVHEPGSKDSKSVFDSIKDARKNSGEMYLRGISRETSKMGFDMASTFSDGENQMVLNRTEAILKAITSEIDQVGVDGKGQKVYLSKLLRYKKYFSYRKTILEYKSMGNITDLKTRLLKDIKISRAS